LISPSRSPRAEAFRVAGLIDTLLTDYLASRQLFFLTFHFSRGYHFIESHVFLPPACVSFSVTPPALISLPLIQAAIASSRH